MNHKQLDVVLVIEEDGRPTADIQSLNLGLSFPPINNSFRRFLSGISQHPRFNLIRHQLTINNLDYSKVKVKVVKVFEQNIILT